MFDDLIERGLVKEKYDPATGLAIYKYTKKVFYDNLWHLDSRLLQARGLVLHKPTGKIVARPFDKVFNHNENGATAGFYQKVVATRKVNGFMASVSIFNGEPLVSTTGSLDSPFVDMAKEVIPVGTTKYHPSYTYIYEVVHPNDPHIIDEKPGAYIIGMRHNDTGELVDDRALHNRVPNVAAPSFYIMNFGDIVRMTQHVKHEGFVVRDYKTRQVICKIKSPYYLTKKFLMRMTPSKVALMWDNPRQLHTTIDEEFYGVVEEIKGRHTKEEWLGMDDQGRKAVLDGFFRVDP